MMKACACLFLLPACSLLFSAESNQQVGDDSGAGKVADGAATNEDAGGAAGLEFQWLRHLTGQDSIELNDIALSSGGDVYVAGLFQEALKFDDTSTSITGGGLAEIFVGRILSTGAGNWLVSAPAAGRASASHLDFQGGDLVVAGTFDTSITLFSNTTTTAGGNDIWWANVAPTNGGLSILRTSGGPNADFVRGLARVGSEPALAASLGAQAQFFGQVGSPVGGTDVFLGTTPEGTDKVFQYGAAGDEAVTDLVAAEGGLHLLLAHDSALSVGGSNLPAPAADGISLVQHDGTVGTSKWGLTVADLLVSERPTMHYNTVSKTTLVAGLGQSSSAVIGGAPVDLANRTGWAVLVDSTGSVIANVLVRSDWTDGIAGCVLDDGKLVIAAFVDGGTPAVEVNGTVSVLNIAEPALVVFVVDPDEEAVISELAFPATGTVKPQRMLSMPDGSITLGSRLDGSLTLPDGAAVNAFNSGFPDSFVMRLKL